MLPEVEVLILTKNCNLQHFEFKKAGFVNTWFRFFDVRNGTYYLNIKCVDSNQFFYSGMMDSRFKN